MSADFHEKLLLYLHKEIKKDSLKITKDIIDDIEKLLTDTAFLFWKYFKIDITLCKECGKGHIHFVHSPDGGG